MVTTVASRNIARRWGAGTAAIARLLVASPEPLTGVAIAESVGVSQPRASQVLKQFSAWEAVEATEDGYVGDARALLDLYEQRSRPTLVEPESYWYSTRPMLEQSKKLVRRARQQNASIAISADLAPDLLVPWRHPTLTVVYTDVEPMSIAADLVPAEGRADASIIARRTIDATLLAPTPPWPSSVDGFPLTDPVQQWWDLLDLGGGDRREAADRLRGAILERSLPGAR
jgi:hypothetical protein